MGSSVHLHISTNGHDVVVIVPTNGNAAHFPMGSEVNMIFGGNVAHVFSKETERTWSGNISVIKRPHPCGWGLFCHSGLISPCSFSNSAMRF